MNKKTNKWALKDEEIEYELKHGTIPSERICLGCAAKVNLVDTVYPALDIVKERTSNLKFTKFQKRDDSYYFHADRGIQLARCVLPLPDLATQKNSQVTATLKSNGAGGAILLFNFTPNPKISYFADILTNFLLSLEDAHIPVVVGKGHTIQLARTPEETCVMVDFISHSGSKLWGLANNDTIANVDPMLPHSHKFAVSIAMHNTLNDLFVYGITEDFLIYPSYDGRDENTIDEIQQSIKWYQERYSDIGLTIYDQGPLKTNNKLIGATVVGFTDKEIPLNTGLNPGQTIIATRPIGDLAPLNEYLMRKSLEEDTCDLEPLRHHVIKTMLIPNIEVAKIIRDYLPPIGDEINPLIHITATRDMSGPGILALEELAQDSSCDIYLEQIAFHDEQIANIEVTNVTAGTNGAILIGAEEKLNLEIMSRLKEAGFEPWLVGRVLEKSDAPKIVIDKSLQKYKFLTSGRGFFKNKIFA